MSSSATTQAPTSRSPQQIWELALAQLQLQMTRATFDTWVKETHAVAGDGDSLVVGVKSVFAQDWLENRLFATIQRVLTNIMGHPVELRFVVEPDVPAADRAITVPVEERDDWPIAESPGPVLSPGQQVAQADYYKGFFEKGGVGFSLLVHHTTYYWMPLLGPAFFLWKFLDSADIRSLKSIKPNFWSLPQKYSYVELATKLNRQHSRYICGDALECHQSREARQAGHPLQSQDDCCLSSAYRWLRLISHPKHKGLICKHWKDGLLEILCQEGLAAVELIPGERKPTIQVWRMPPVLTPRQYARLNVHLQADYDHWLDQYGQMFNIHSRQEWRSIEEPSLAPLMPAYDQLQVSHNFEQRPKKQEFNREAFANPNFRPDVDQYLT
ncbi:MAG: hypothetical protein KDJ65_08225 [Anaerolineae bacterium]|nr:hypothetical protein [Anaerolineae bacterium]